MRLLTVVAGFALAGQLVPPSPPPPPQGGPVRDTVARPAPVGTGVIRGRVIAADSGSPIRKANVTLQPVVPPVSMPPVRPPGASAQTSTVIIDGVPRTVNSSIGLSVNLAARSQNVTTDMQGGFEFTGLPGGAYRLFASAGQYSAAYLPMSYGGKRPAAPGLASDAGTAIELAEGQRFEKATIALPHGSAITGRVVDENGEPMARVQVSALYLSATTVRPVHVGGGGNTDDLGQFRLYGLPPGDFVVVAEARGPTFVAPNAPAEREEDRTGFLTTYFPGTADESSAQRVRTALGSDAQAIEIRMVSGRLFHVTGTISDSQGRPGARTNGSLVRASVTAGSTNYGFSSDELGRFQMRNIPPGNYRLIVRSRPAGPSQANEPGEIAVLPIGINADIDGLVVVTGPGATITGQIVFEHGPPQPIPGQLPPTLRVTAVAADPRNSGPIPTPPAVVVSPDYTFTMKGMVGEWVLRASAPRQIMKAVMVGAEDISDTPHEFKNGERVSIVMTSAGSSLEGTVTDARGVPVPEAAILVFSEDKASWRPNSLRMRRAGTDAAGAFRVTGLLAGRYFILAVPRDRLAVSSFDMDAAFFEALTKDATTFVIGEDDQRQMDLKIIAGPGH